VFHNIINDPSALVEIFINYDCDFEEIDLFRRIVDAFAKIAKNANNSSNSIMRAAVSLEFISSGNKKGNAEEISIRLKCVEGLVTILRSLLKTAGIGDAASGSGNEPSTPSGSGGASAAAGGGGGAGGGGTGIHRRKSVLMDAASAAAAIGVIDNDHFPVSDEKGGIGIGIGMGDADDSQQSDAASGNPTHSSLVSVSVGGAVEAFDRKQRVQEEIETGILKFNLSSKKGLAYLASLGHIELTPESVARFLHQYQDRLDKTTVGDYLGRERDYENGFCLKVNQLSHCII
jgi:brefeldin A-inhibited guanine nucleotide-exchange protein